MSVTRSETLRERKKNDTRDRITAVALELFLERGFDEVPIGEIARAADVAPATVFNYFPTKEDLVYRQLEAFWDRVVQAVADRSPETTTPLDAYDAFLKVQRVPVESTERLELLLRVTRMITSSPSLLDREARVYEEAVQALVAVLAPRLAPVEAEVTARALAGAHRTVQEVVRRSVLDGAGREAINRRVENARVEAVALLRGGFGG